MHRWLLLALVHGSPAEPGLRWTAPVDFGAPCSRDAGALELPARCVEDPAFVAQVCVDRLLAPRLTRHDLCDDQCRCPFGSTCVGDSSLQLCMKRCFAPDDCGRGQVCHRFFDSAVSACVPIRLVEWLRPADARPDERRYWRPGFPWREPRRFEPPTPADRVRDFVLDERRRAVFRR